MVKIGEHRTLQGFMPPTTLKADQAHRLVVQVLDRITTPQQRDTVLEAALGAADATEVPADAGALTAFVLGPLREAVAQTVGPTAAGMMVKFLTPVLAHQAVQIRDQQPAPSEAAADQAGPVDGPVTVLIVDRNIQMRSQVARVLQKHGYGAVSAPDVDVALAMCVRYRPALIIAELEADSRDSEKFTALLQVAFGAEAPPVMALTFDLVAARGKRHADHVEANPIMADELIAAVQRLLEPAEHQD